MSDQWTLSQLLDATQPPNTRMSALAELAIDGQKLVVAYFNHRRMPDGDTCQDLASEVWVTLTQHITEGKYQDCGKDPMAYVYGICARVLLHHRSRDRRFIGALVSLDDRETALENRISDESDDLDDLIDRNGRYDRLISNLDEPVSEIARLWYEGHTPKEIAEQSDRNIKTVRKYLREIAEHIQAMIAAEATV